MDDLHWFVRYYLSQSYINKANNIYEYVKIKIQTERETNIILRKILP